MPLINRYLFRQFSQLVAAVLLVLFLISVGGFLTDLIAEISRGKVPATLMLQLLVLRMPRFLSFVMPLALFIGLMMAIARLYADSEMAVLASVGVGSRSLWRPVALVAAPLVLMIAFASLWLVPWTAQKAKTMVEEANRSFLVSGLEPGRFVDLPGNSGILFVTELSRDGRQFKNLFVQREINGRLDIITASKGDLSYIEQAVLSVCVEASKDDTLGLVKTLKAYRISKDNAVKKVVCNSQPLVDFARTEQAHKVVKLLAPLERRINGNVNIQDVDAPL